MVDAGTSIHMPTIFVPAATMGVRITGNQRRQNEQRYLQLPELIQGVRSVASRQKRELEFFSTYCCENPIYLTSPLIQGDSRPIQVWTRSGPNGLLTVIIYISMTYGRMQFLAKSSTYSGLAHTVPSNVLYEPTSRHGRKAA